MLEFLVHIISTIGAITSSTAATAVETLLRYIHPTTFAVATLKSLLTTTVLTASQQRRTRQAKGTQNIHRNLHHPPTRFFLQILVPLTPLTLPPGISSILKILFGQFKSRCSLVLFTQSGGSLPNMIYTTTIITATRVRTVVALVLVRKGSTMNSNTTVLSETSYRIAKEQNIEVITLMACTRFEDMDTFHNDVDLAAPVPGPAPAVPVPAAIVVALQVVIFAAPVYADVVAPCPG
ncbi:MAG: hypothetical protein J3R72DRAFT_422713 [Linnemannia gamsii]|nr:MAG: hypothetical protein J3R72DRAFT_422713 [Linnemannia gamsii]